MTSILLLLLFSNEHQLTSDPDVSFYDQMSFPCSLKSSEKIAISWLWLVSIVSSSGSVKVSESSSTSSSSSSSGKTENVLPAYCNPPNPCPIGYTGMGRIFINHFMSFHSRVLFKYCMKQSRGRLPRRIRKHGRIQSGISSSSGLYVWHWTYGRFYFVWLLNWQLDN